MFIPQVLRNLAADSEIFPQIPKHLVALEVVAAASVLAQSLALDEEPNRHHFLESIPRYLAALPSDPLEAAQVCKRDASAVLKIDLAADHDQLVTAIREADLAAAKVAELESQEGRKLARIHQLESLITDATRRLETWQIDFDAEEKLAEKAILDHWGVNPVNAPFDTLAKIAVLRKLAPAAVASITAELDAHKAELDALTAAPTKAKSPRQERVLVEA
jgi:hypothetical protein